MVAFHFTNYSRSIVKFGLMFDSKFPREYSLVSAEIIQKDIVFNGAIKHYV
jgi:hypothetical protein